MSAGLKTTELWLTVATEVGIVAAALSSALSPHWAAVASAASAGAYAIARGLAKTESTQPVVALPVAHTQPAATLTGTAGVQPVATSSSGIPPAA